MAARDKVYEDVNKIKSNVQGGKAFGAQLSAFERELDSIGQEYLAGNSEATQDDVDKYKAKFLVYDEDRSGDISLDELKRMMEKLGKAVTHNEAVKMISQVDTVGKGTIHYKYVINIFYKFKHKSSLYTNEKARKKRNKIFQLFSLHFSPLSPHILSISLHSLSLSLSNPPLSLSFSLS